MERVIPTLQPRGLPWHQTLHCICPRSWAWDPPVNLFVLVPQTQGVGHTHPFPPTSSILLLKSRALCLKGLCQLNGQWFPRETKRI